MTNTEWYIHTKDFGILTADSVVSNQRHSLTRGETTELTFSFEGQSTTGTPELTVSSGFNKTIAATESEEYTTVTVEQGGSLTVEEDGQITSGVESTDATGEDAWLKAQQHADHAGSYEVLSTLSNKQPYSERLPNNADVSTLAVGIEPSQDLKDKDVTGIWGLVESGQDERNNPLVDYDYTLSLYVLAEYSEYADHTELEADLKI